MCSKDTLALVMVNFLILVAFVVFVFVVYDIGIDSYLDDYPQEYITKDNVGSIVEQIDIIAVADHQLATIKNNGYDSSDGTQRSLCLLHYKERSEAVAAWYATVGVAPSRLYEHQPGLNTELAQIEKFHKDILYNEGNSALDVRLNQNTDYTAIPADKNADCG